MQLRGVIDCLIPAGASRCSRSVQAEATVPCVIDGDGNCHVYVDAAPTSTWPCPSSSTPRRSARACATRWSPSLVHATWPTLPAPGSQAPCQGVELVGDERRPGRSSPWGRRPTRTYATEFLALKMSVAVVDDLDAAIAHIARY